MTLYVLDTDMTTLLLRGHPSVSQRAASHPSDDLAITIVTVEEILSGWYTQIRRAKKDDQVASAYAALLEAVTFLARVRILPFEPASVKEFRLLRSLKPRIGTNDLRIAAIVRTHGGKLVTRNEKDFEGIPGLDTEDWS